MNNDQIWRVVLGQLQNQMTQATFESWVKDTYLVSLDDEKLVIGTNSVFAKEWLENRLFTVIDRTVTGILERSIDIQFIIGGNNKNGPDATSHSVDLLPDDLISDAAATEITPTPAAAPFPTDESSHGHPLAIHFQELNRKSYYTALAHYWSQFWQPYLGVKAYLLWEVLVSFDNKRSVKAKKFTHWTPPLRLSYRELAKLLHRTSHLTIKGRQYHCQRYEKAREEWEEQGHPSGLPDIKCCGIHKPSCGIRASNNGTYHCYYWQPGLLEKLDAEDLLAIEDPPGNSRDHKLRLQVWRSLPILTPDQVGQLDEFLRDKHWQWLGRFATAFGFKRSEWKDVSIRSAVPLFPDYEEGRECFGKYQVDPFKNGIYEMNP